MATNSCVLLTNMKVPASLALSFLMGCMVFLIPTVQPAKGQSTQEEFQPAFVPDSRQYQTLLSQTNIAFLEFSGSRDIDDPFQDFFAYVGDPVNWDSSEGVERRTVYQTHAGFQTHKRIFNGTSSLRFGFETQMEHAHVSTLPSSGADRLTSEKPQNLVDFVHAPYLTLESQPFSWIRMLGNLRMHIIALDVQHVCPKTCSLKPEGQGINMVPSFRGELIFGPWNNTQFFFNFGKGFYRLDERNPVGSTGEQQINRTRFIELGFLTHPGDSIELRGSLWGAKNNSDFFYNLDDQNFVNQGSSHRYGGNLEGRIDLPYSTTLRGRLTVSRSTFRQTRQPIPLTPQLVGHATLHKDWNTNWATSLQWQYIGDRTTSNQTFPAFQTVDFLAQYHLPKTDDTGDLTASLGILNVGNHRSSFSLFHFDSGHTPDHNQALDINYFPSPPRTVVAGISYFF